jgi:hypothetical protein
VRLRDAVHAVALRRGFSLVDSDRALGIGDNGRPVCPNGHGEMDPGRRAAADRAGDRAEPPSGSTRRRSGCRIPVAAVQLRGRAARDLRDGKRAVAILEAKFNDADDRRKKAKAALDDGHTELSALIETLQEREEDRLHEIARRDAAAAAGHPEDTNLVRCAWEQAHPDEACPICTDDRGSETARDSSLHIDEVERFLYASETESILALLDGIRLSPDVVNGWSVEDRIAVKTWAENPAAHERPAVMGTAHIASDVITSEADGDTFQSCRECNARIWSVKTGEDPEARLAEAQGFPAGTLVGTDCEGAKEPARYAKRGKRAKAAK